MDELALARELADMADDISMRYFGKAQQVIRKSDGSPLTAADGEIEELIRKRIGQAFPGHGTFGEEAGLQGHKDGPLWVIDPIDGTSNFAAGIPIFATLIGLRVQGRTEVAVVSAPALAERYEAAAGDGARMNGKTIAVSGISEIGEAAVCFGAQRRMIRYGYGDKAQNLLAACRRDRGFGDFWGHMLVARGCMDAMAEPALEPWDVIPLEVIISEAGGRLTTFQGGRYPESTIGISDAGQRRKIERSCLSTNGKLHDTVVGILSS